MFELQDPADPLCETPERASFRRSLRELVERVAPPARVSELDELEEFDDVLYGHLAAMGVLGIGAPAWAGRAGDVLDQLVAVEELAAGPTSMAAFLISHFAVVQVLATHGRTDGHRALVGALAEGRTKVSFALSEPDGGTDVARSMQTRARAVDGGWRIDGQKMWTSGAALAEHIVVLARTAPVTGSPVAGITTFLVPADAAGVEIRTIDTFGIHGMSTCEVFLDGVAVPDDAVIGDVGNGMRQVFATVNREGLNAAAATLGVGRAALELAVAYTSERRVFDKPIGAFQVPQHWMVDGAVALEAARGLMMRAAHIEASGGRADVLAAMAKLVASEAAVDIALKGMQLMGGLGFTRQVAMQRFFRDGRLWSFSPLTNEMVRNRIGEQHLGLPRSY